MIIEKITINNMGIYKGPNKFDLTPKSLVYGRKPVILIGGKNGTGKTTILESIKLCLYGIKSQGSKLSQKEYHNYLLQRLNKYTLAVKGKRQSFIELVFEYTRIGETFQYKTKRSWIFENQIVKEKLDIWKNDVLLTDMDENQLNEFLSELIPLEFFELFFFDGEKINSLFNPNQHSSILKDNFESLLKIDLLKKLEEDINIYLGKIQRKFNLSKTEDFLDSLQNEKMSNIEEIKKIKMDNASNKTQIKRIENEINLENRKLASNGGTFAKKRENFLQQEITLENQIQFLHEQITFESEGLLPFSLITNLTSKLKKQLSNEIELLIWELGNDSFNKNLHKFKKEIPKLDFVSKYNITNDDKKELTIDIIDKIKKIIEIKPLKIGNIERLHNLSLTESQELISLLDEESLIDNRNVFLGFISDIKELSDKLDIVKKNLRRAPADEILKLSVEKINYLILSQNETEGIYENNTVKIDDLKKRNIVLGKLITKSQKELKKLEKEKRNVQLALNVVEILKEYYQKLKETKLTRLEIEVKKYFNLICGKQDKISQVHIDRENYTINIFGEDKQKQTLLFNNSNNHNQEKLSAGENQLFIFSLIWALIMLSNRKLMFLIDTPLGRLDSTHRINIVKEFFPKISHQVIILSTDTELNQDLLKKLEPHISHTYLLEYNQKMKTVEIKNSYFVELDLDDKVTKDKIIDLEVKF